MDRDKAKKMTTERKLKERRSLSERDKRGKEARERKQAKAKEDHERSDCLSFMLFHAILCYFVLLHELHLMFDIPYCCVVKLSINSNYFAVMPVCIWLFKELSLQGNKLRANADSEQRGIVRMSSCCNLLFYNVPRMMDKKRNAKLIMPC